MPLGTDWMLAHGVALRRRRAARAGRRRGPAAALHGYSPHHMRFPAPHAVVATLSALVGDIVASVVAHGFRRIVLVNGHGGNAGIIDVLAADLGARHYGVARVAGLTYFRLAQAAIAALRESAPGGMGHACEFETAMMPTPPRHVHMDRAVVAYPTPARGYSTDLLQGSRVGTYLDFKDLPNGTGDRRCHAGEARGSSRRLPTAATPPTSAAGRSAARRKLTLAGPARRSALAHEIGAGLAVRRWC
jgi:creatinine amidohydrolase